MERDLAASVAGVFTPALEGMGIELQQVTIESAKGKKGRAFSATLVAHITAPLMFPEGEASTIRPVWALFAGSDSELRAFVANLRLGRRAEPANTSSRVTSSSRLEFLTSVEYQFAWQRETEGSLVTVYHPTLFLIDPGMVEPSGIAFMTLIPEAWALGQQVPADAAVRHVLRLECRRRPDELARLMPSAYLFAAALDRRTRSPLLADPRFYLQLLCACLDSGLASLEGAGDDWEHRRHDLKAEGLEHVGARHVLAFKASHEEFESFLAEQVTRFFDVELSPRAARRNSPSLEAQWLG